MAFVPEAMPGQFEQVWRSFSANRLSKSTSLVPCSHHGETSHSREFSEEAYKLAGQPNELVVVPGASHGLAVASAFAAPIGSCVGGIIGWRGVFWAMTPLAVVTLFWQWLSLPSMEPQTTNPVGKLFGLLKRRHIAFGMAGVMLKLPSKHHRRTSRATCALSAFSMLLRLHEGRAVWSALRPEARSAWHKHPLGQTLIVTAGTGRVQQWGSAVQEIRKGDTVRIPANVKH